MISHGMSYGIFIFDCICLQQDCVCLIAPFPFNIQPVGEFDASADFDVTGEGNVWYARPQLFFSCTVCRCDHQENCSSHKELSLVFFSTFEPMLPINLSPDYVMQREREVPMLYELSERQLPTLCLSSRERARTGASHIMLSGGQHTSNHSIWHEGKKFG